MGKINGCLKCLFIFFNVLYAIIGCVLIYGAVKLSIFSSQMAAVGSPGLGWIWVFAIGVLGISSLGIFAACSEKELALKIFAGFMVLGMIIMMIVGIIIVVARNKVRDNIDQIFNEVVKPVMEDEGARALLEAIQQSGQCCGVVDASDWGDKIPDSCHCSAGGAYGGYGASVCKARPQGLQGPDRIYSKTCGETIFGWINLFFQIWMAVFFGFAVTALMGLLISILMIHQVRRHNSAGGASIAMKSY
ncbi:CD63 antigen-like [Sebastes umbrosus]|uniref:CD63 antigen-like n=1 Tax=Sebastes umbrosus TaxID=72105 RepID=UPI00189C7F8A|nr:CD63 antigen-like [Sebastes umbrosus]